MVAVRAPVDHIAAPPFPRELPWINTAPLRMDQQLGRPVLIEFWDFCRPNSIRTLPYLKAWHERYVARGLRVIGVHAAGFEPSRDPEAVSAAVARLEVPYPVVVDTELEIWERYGNLGWPARYLFNQRRDAVRAPLRRGRLRRDRAGDPGAARNRGAAARAGPARGRPGGADRGRRARTSRGEYSGPYRAGAVWAVLDGDGTVTVNGSDLEVDHPGCYELLSHPRSTDGELELRVGAGVRCHAVCFTPGRAG